MLSYPSVFIPNRRSLACVRGDQDVDLRQSRFVERPGPLDYAVAIRAQQLGKRIELPRGGVCVRVCRVDGDRRRMFGVDGSLDYRLE
jgi:hypothetical protein